MDFIKQLALPLLTFSIALISLFIDTKSIKTLKDLGKKPKIFMVILFLSLSTALTIYSSLSEAAKKQAEVDREKKNHDVLVEYLAHLNQSSEQIRQELKAFIDSDIFDKSKPAEIKEALSDILGKLPKQKTKVPLGVQPEGTTELSGENIVLDIENQDDSVDYIIIDEAKGPWDGIFNMDDVDSLPSYPGGLEALSDYISNNIEYPEQARRMGIEGKVYVQAFIMKSGFIMKVGAVRGIGAGCDEEAVRVIDESGRWKPAIKDGKPVICRLILPVTFKLN